MIVAVVLVVCVTAASAQWCLVEPKQRTDCLFTDAVNCTSFGCCWAGPTQPGQPLCYDPENGCVGPAMTRARAAVLLSEAVVAKVGTAGLRVTTRECDSANCSSPWVDANDSVHLVVSGQLCVASQCPWLVLFLLNSSDVVYAGVTAASPCTDSGHTGELDFANGLIGKMSICGDGVALPDGQVLSLVRGYTTDTCAHFISPVYVMKHLQLSISLRFAFE